MKLVVVVVDGARDGPGRHHTTPHHHSSRHLLCGRDDADATTPPKRKKKEALAFVRGYSARAYVTTSFFRRRGARGVGAPTKRRHGTARRATRHDSRASRCAGSFFSSLPLERSRCETWSALGERGGHAVRGKLTAFFLPTSGGDPLIGCLCVLVV
jgi:hypothetical protein